MATLQGKKVVIVGGSSGIGLATARIVMEQGAELVIASRSEKKLHQAREQLGSTVQVYPLDATNEKEVEQFFSSIGAFDHLVTSVSTSSRGSILDTNIATVRHWFETKFWGQYIVTRYAVDHLKRGGSMTLFSGAASSKPAPGGTTIAAQNGAVEAYGRALAFEIAPSRVNVVSPGLIDTPLWDRLAEDERRSIYAATAQKIPAGRVGTAEDCAHAVLFLLTNEFMTGTVLSINGGALLV